MYDDVYAINSILIMSCGSFHHYRSIPLLHVVAAHLSWDSLLSRVGWQCQRGSRLQQIPLLAPISKPGSCLWDMFLRQQWGPLDYEDQQLRSTGEFFRDKLDEKDEWRCDITWIVQSSWMDGWDLIGFHCIRGIAMGRIMDWAMRWNRIKDFWYAMVNKTPRRIFQCDVLRAIWSGKKIDG